MAERIQLRRTKGWRLPPGAVKVDRATRWGNPFNLRASAHGWTALAHGFKAHAAGRQAASVAMFRAWVIGGKPAVVSDCGMRMSTPGQPDVQIGEESPEINAPAPPTLAEIRDALRGKDLACWCEAGQPCHADVLLELANAPETAP